MELASLRTRSNSKKEEYVIQAIIKAITTGGNPKVKEHWGRLAPRFRVKVKASWPKDETFPESLPLTDEGGPASRTRRKTGQGNKSKDGPNQGGDQGDKSKDGPNQGGGQGDKSKDGLNQGGGQGDKSKDGLNQGGGQGDKSKNGLTQGGGAAILGRIPGAPARTKAVELYKQRLEALQKEVEESPGEIDIVQRVIELEKELMDNLTSDLRALGLPATAGTKKRPAFMLEQGEDEFFEIDDDDDEPRLRRQNKRQDVRASPDPKSVRERSRVEQLAKMLGKKDAAARIKEDEKSRRSQGRLASHQAYTRMVHSILPVEPDTATEIATLQEMLAPELKILNSRETATVKPLTFTNIKSRVEDGLDEFKTMNVTEQYAFVFVLVSAVNVDVDLLELDLDEAVLVMREPEYLEGVYLCGYKAFVESAVRLGYASLERKAKRVITMDDDEPPARFPMFSERRVARVTKAMEERPAGGPRTNISVNRGPRVRNGRTFMMCKTCGFVGKDGRGHPQGCQLVKSDRDSLGASMSATWTVEDPYAAQHVHFFMSSKGLGQIAVVVDKHISVDDDAWAAYVDLVEKAVTTKEFAHFKDKVAERQERQRESK